MYQYYGQILSIFSSTGLQGHGPPTPQSAKISKQIGPHFGDHPAPSQYAALSNGKYLNRPWVPSVVWGQICLTHSVTDPILDMGPDPM